MILDEIQRVPGFLRCYAGLSMRASQRSDRFLLPGPPRLTVVAFRFLLSQGTETGMPCGI